MTSTKWFTLCLAGCALLLSACENQVRYTEDVQPILFSACLSCHDRDSEGYLNSGFSLDSYEAVMKGTNFGAVVVPGSQELLHVFKPDLPNRQSLSPLGEAVQECA